jgi:hypothetical protein
MAANPNGFGYWLRDGAILPPYTLGKVGGTAMFGYWLRDGALIYPAAIQPAAVPSQQGLMLMFPAAVMRI